MKIDFNKEKNTVETTIDGQRAYLNYVINDNRLDIRHTFVPEGLRGKNIASDLVKAAYDYALSNNLTPVATCSYAVMWLERHPEYKGKTGKDYGGPGTCAI